MKIQVKYLRHLVNELVTKHRETHENRAYEAIGDEIVGIGPAYLYKKIVNPISNLRGNDWVGLRDAKLTALVKHLGYQNVKAFIYAVDKPISEQLQSCEGVYYSYLRKNTTEDLLLRSPVKICRSDHRMIMELRGQRLNYIGELKLQNGYLHVLLVNEKTGKQFYHGYKIGSMEKPQVLQGIFSGVTSGFDPIGGRVVLVKVEVGKFEVLKIGQIEIDILKHSQQKDEQALGEYFEKRSENNLNIGNTTSFGFGDLAE